MTRTIAAACFAAALLSCGFASANNSHDDDDNNNGGGTATAVGVGVGISNVRSTNSVKSTNTNTNVNVAEGGSVKSTNTNIATGGAGGKGGSSVAVAAGGAGGKGGEANADAYSTSAVGAVSNIGGSITNRVETKYIAPPMYVEPSNNTLACLRTIGIAASGAGNDGAGGTSLGYSTKDHDCQLSIDEANAFKRGDLSTGWALYCRNTSVLEVFGYTKGVWWQGKPTIGTRNAAIDACVADKQVISEDGLSGRLGVIETQRAVDAIEVERLERKVDTLLPVSK